MKFFICIAAVSLCLIHSGQTQQLPNYFQGSFQVPNAPIPSPGATIGSQQAASGQWSPSPAPQSYRPQAAAYPASLARSAPAQLQTGQWSPSPAPASPQYSPSPAAYQRSLAAGQPLAPQAAPVSHIPSSYGWNVQHSSPRPQPQPQPQPQAALIPTAQQPAPGQYQQYAPQSAPAPASPQWSPAAPARVAQPAPQWSPAAAAQVAPATPISAALRPASVHYASVGENLNGDYKFGYRTGDGNSFREETRAPDGTVQGQYGFVDADGKQRVVKYQAGVGGFQVLGGSDGVAPTPAAPSPVSAAGQQRPQQQWDERGFPIQPAASAAPQAWGQQQQAAAASPQQWG